MTITLFLVCLSPAVIRQIPSTDSPCQWSRSSHSQSWRPGLRPGWQKGWETCSISVGAVIALVLCLIVHVMRHAYSRIQEWRCDIYRHRVAADMWQNTVNIMRELNLKNIINELWLFDSLLFTKIQCLIVCCWPTYSVLLMPDTEKSVRSRCVYRSYGWQFVECKDFAAITNFSKSCWTGSHQFLDAVCWWHLFVPQMWSEWIFKMETSDNVIKGVLWDFSLFID